jgi:hypothetical protein
MEVVDKIGYLRTETVANFGGDVPIERPVLRRAYVLEDSVTAPATPPAPPQPNAEKADAAR